jgi:hypothetical protein
MNVVQLLLPSILNIAVTVDASLSFTTSSTDTNKQSRHDYHNVTSRATHYVLLLAAVTNIQRTADVVRQAPSLSHSAGSPCSLRLSSVLLASQVLSHLVLAASIHSAHSAVHTSYCSSVLIFAVPVHMLQRC